MSDDINAGIWLNNFMQEVEKSDPELIGLYSNRISFSQNEKGDLYPAFWDLDEMYATKEQIQRMRELFDGFEKRNPF